jgi:hypothetical protein
MKKMTLVKMKMKISGWLERSSELPTNSRIIECGKYSKEQQTMSGQTTRLR